MPIICLKALIHWTVRNHPLSILEKKNTIKIKVKQVYIGYQVKGFQ
jgi:hypothetical protein